MKFNTYDIIEQYLEGKLSAADQKMFESAMQQDNVLRTKVETHQWANDLVIDNRLLSVKNQLHIQHKKSKTYQRTKKLIGSALVGASLIVAIYYFSTSNHKPHIGTSPIYKEVITNEPEDFKETKTTKSSIPKAKIASEGNSSSPENPIIVAETTLPDSAILEEQPTVSISSETTDPISTNLAEEDNIHDLATICAKTKIKADISTTGSCPNEKKGSIHLKNIAGGLAPYEVFISNEKEEIIHERNALNPGKYSIDVVDANGCIQPLNTVYVESLNCMISFTFNPSVGEDVHFSQYFEQGYIKVFNQQSQVVFEGKLSKGQDLIWNGYNQNGKIEDGYYIFSVELSNGNIKTGEITLLK